MTKEFDQAVELARKLPARRQNEAAALLMAIVEQESSNLRLTPEQIARVKEAIQRADAGEFATDEEVEAVYAKHGA